MTVQSNLLMSRLVQARMSCSSYPKYQEKWMALTPALSPFTDHHKSSASDLHQTLLEPAFPPQFPSDTASLPQQILLLRPTPSQPRGSPLYTQKCCIFTILQLLPKSPTRFAGNSWDCRGSAERFCLPPVLAPLPLVCLTPPAPATISNSSLCCHFPSQLLPAPCVLLTLLFPLLETPCKCQTGISRHYVLH